MKATARDKFKFKPIEVEVILESQDEIDLFYSIFNFAPICKLFRDIKADPDIIRNVLEESTNECLSYTKQFDLLQVAMRNFNR